MKKEGRTQWTRFGPSCDVLITFFGKNKICVNSQVTEKNGGILMLDVMIDGS